MTRVPPAAPEKSREWRRKVLVSARIRSTLGWGDARILNVSSRGLMIRTAFPTNPGSLIELRRGDEQIFARVMWQNGTRAGLRSDTILPLTELMCASEKPGDTAPQWAPRRLPKQARAIAFSEEAQRQRARSIQFAVILGAVASAAFGLGSVAMATLGEPLRAMEAAFAG